MAGVPERERASALVVEDDPHVARLLREVLSMDGHHVAAIEDGALAASAVRALRPEVVLLDIGLPNVHGLEILDELKRDPDTAGIPVIIVTAWWTAELARRARGMGAASVLAKPFDIAQVRRAVVAARAGATADAVTH